MVIGRARGLYGRVEDFYTRDRSTPRVDQFYGGQQDLTAALAYEQGGRTVVVFRRPLVTADPADHSIDDTPQHVVWARGQEPGQYCHTPVSGLERGSASLPDFYRPDEIKYHGRGGGQRGHLLLNFLESATTTEMDSSSSASSHAHGDCGDEWLWPRGCSFDRNDCEYAVRWTFMPDTDHVHFTVQSSSSDSWTGVGFSGDRRMPNSDAVLGFVPASGAQEAVVRDVWLSGYRPPSIDEQQNVFNVTAQRSNGRQVISFVRPRVTSDEQDLEFGDEQCFHMLFPIKGGDFVAENMIFGFHKSTPKVSSKKICIKACDHSASNNSLMSGGAGESIPAQAASHTAGRVTRNFRRSAGNPQAGPWLLQLATITALGILVF